MQVMPFWTRLIGTPDSNLFHMRTNLRFGCTILRHYLDIEKGDLFRALGRYNGSLGKAEYPNLVRAAWERNWSYAKLSDSPRAPEAKRIKYERAPAAPVLHWQSEPESCHDDPAAQAHLAFVHHHALPRRHRPLRLGKGDLGPAAAKHINLTRRIRRAIARLGGVHPVGARIAPRHPRQVGSNQAVLQQRRMIMPCTT
jgi:hypothetical protein